jgi:hypothetical protein
MQGAYSQKTIFPADSANSANSAGTANSAGNANSAENANSANSAGNKNSNPKTPNKQYTDPFCQN